MQEIIRNQSDTIINKYQEQNDNFNIILQGNANVKFWAVIKNSQISFTFNAISENCKAECFFLIPAIKNQNVNLDIKTNFKASNTKILINVIVLATDNATIHLNGNLHITDGINKLEARLYEETLLIWKAKYISLIPGLRVDSTDVIASHWAKIQRISTERIFYMQSRWLSSEKAINMILNSYSQHIAQELDLNDDQKSDFYSMIN